MTNSTETYWEADNQSLQTFARNIETLGGSRGGVPSMRGEDIVIPYMPGEVWVPKVAGSRTLTLAMWVRNTDVNGVKGGKAQFQANWSDLQQLLWTPGRRFTLRKRFYLADGTVKSVVAQAEFAGGLEPSMMGPNAAKTTVDLKLAEGCFYDEAFTTIVLNDGINNFVVPGNMTSFNARLVMNDGHSDPTIHFNTPAVIASNIRAGQTLVTGDTLTMNALTFQSLYTPNGGTTRDIAAQAVHSGMPQWFGVSPGPSTVTVDNDPTTNGILSLQYKAAWF